MKAKFKKLCCLVLIVIMMMMSCINVSAADTTDGGMSDELKGVVELLRLLEIIPDYYDYNVNINDKVTRADFAATVAKLIYCPDYTGNPYYYDVPQTHWAYNEICSLTQLGVLSGHSDKLFTPDRTVTKAEAYKIITTVLGYEVYAQRKGGFPTGYMAAALDADITDGVSASTEVTIADMFMILYNSLTAPVMKNTSFSANATYEVDENDSVLAMYRDIYHEKGVVTGADGVTLDGEDLYEKYVTVDGEQYTFDIELGQYLGEEIEFFYHRDEANDENKILWAELTGRTEVLRITAKNDAEFDKTSYELEYVDYEKDKYRTISLSRSCVVVYNGKVVNSNLSDIFNMPKYEAKFIEGDGRTYDIAIVNAYENYMVKSLNDTNFVVYDKLVSGRNLDLDESHYERFAINLLGTKEMTFSELQANNILSVYKSLDGEFIKVSVCSETVSGTIETVDHNENGGKILTINDIEYFISDAAIEQCPVKPDVGRNFTFYLDVSGDIAYCELSDSTFVPMYLLGAWLDEEAFEERLILKYLNMDGEITRSYTREKLTIDEIRYKDAEQALGQFKVDGVCKPQFMLAKFNTEGEIAAIDTTQDGYGGNDDVLSVNIPYQTGKFYKSDGILNTFGVIDATTFIFSVPFDSNIETAEDYEFTVVKKSAIPNDSDLNFETYRTKDKVGYEQYMVMKGMSGPTLSKTALPILVDSFSMVLDEYDEVVEQLEGWQGTSKIKLMTDGKYSFSASGIEQGDIIRVYTSSLDKVTDADICFDYSEGTVSGAAPSFNGEYTTAVGYVNDVVDGVVRIGYSAADTADITLFSKNIPILVVDTENITRGRLNAYEGTMDDAVTYENAGNECSKIFVMQRRAAPKLYVIYK